jgi:hypothetical protein
MSIETIINDWKNASSNIHPTMMAGENTDMLQYMHQKLEVEKPKISREECGEHDFQFYDLVGTFCSKCDLPFGEECLDSGCRQIKCNKHMLFCKAFSKESYGDVANRIGHETAYIHLGHAGVGTNCKKDVDGLRKLLSSKNLKRLEFCGYYSDEYFYDIIDEDQYKHISFVPIQ